MKKKSAKDLLLETEKFIADKINQIKRENPNHNKARFLENISDIDLYYGVDDSILKQNFGLFPHEITNSAQCTQYAVYQYFLAKQLNFKPRFFLSYGLRQAKGSLNIDEKSVLDHTFIDLDIGDKRKLLMDTLMGSRGLVSYDLDKKEIKLEKSSGNINTKRTYDKLIELQENEIVDLLMDLRTPKGSILAISQYLRTNKRFEAAKYLTSYIFKFLNEENILRSYYNYEMPLIANNSFFSDLHFNNNGEVENSTLTIGMYSKNGCDYYENYLELFKGNQKDIMPFYDFLKKVFLTENKNFRVVKKRPYMQNLEKLTKMGINSFNIESFAYEYRTLIDNSQKEKISNLEKIVEEQFNAREDNQILLKTMLLQTLYWAKREELNGDYLFPLNVRDEPLIEISNQLRDLNLEICQYHQKYFLKCQANLLKDKKITSSARNLIVSKRDEKMSEFEHLALFRKNPSLRYEYDYVTDCYQFAKSMANYSINDLQREVNIKRLSIEEQYKKQVFQKLLLPLQNERLLFNNPFISNLKSMIKKFYLS